MAKHSNRVTLVACTIIFAAAKLASAAPPTPISMCILIDNSGSMEDKQAGAKAAARALVKASNPNDEVCILNFNDEAFPALPTGEPFTSDINKMEQALTRIESRGGKAMRDAIRTSIDQLAHKAHHNRKVIVLITEGTDTSSTISQAQLLDNIKNTGTRLYVLGFLTENDPPRATAAAQALKQISETSGGQAYYPNNPTEAENISRDLANTIRK